MCRLSNEITFLIASSCLHVHRYEYSEFQELTVNGSVITRCGNHNVSNLYSTVNGSCILMLAYILPLSVLLFNYS
ncbi:neuropeptide FF receptor 2, partial [Biomphalaria glabrata]